MIWLLGFSVAAVWVVGVYGRYTGWRSRRARIAFFVLIVATFLVLVTTPNLPTISTPALVAFLLGNLVVARAVVWMAHRRGN